MFSMIVDWGFIEYTIFQKVYGNYVHAQLIKAVVTTSSFLLQISGYKVKKYDN